MARLKIPYESLDPLTIGSSGDESKVYRTELELDVPLLLRPFRAKAIEVLEQEVRAWIEKAKRGELGKTGQ